MTEILGIDNVLLKVKSSQRSISSQRSTILRTLRKKKQKFKPVNVGNKMNKSIVDNNMKNEEKIEIIANARSISYADAIRYNQNM